MSRAVRPQRGSLLTSIVMVMLATVATGLLVVIGFQGLPDTVVPTTFNRERSESRNIDVTGTPTPSVTARPTAPPSATGAPATAGRRTDPPRRTPAWTPRTSRPSYGPRPTAGPPRTSTTSPPRRTATPAPPKATQPPPSSPSPSPTCGPGTRRPKCPKSTRPTRPASAESSSYTASGGPAPEKRSPAQPTTRSTTPAKKTR